MAKSLLKWLLWVGFVAAVGAAGYRPAMRYWENRNKVEWETAKAVTGDLTRYVNSMGTVQPVLRVSVGSFVSGPIVELNVDFNDVVKEGDVLARVDPRLFEAAFQRDQATLETRQAELARVEAQLEQALRNFQRGRGLRETNEDFMSDREMDALTFEVKSLQAQRKLSKASIKQAEAAMEQSIANLNYCEIKAPVDGVVIDRKIDPGQTLAAQFQTPELFVVAPDLREKVHVFASVDEADIGLIQAAQKQNLPVTFTVDAHPDMVFEGTIEQLRVSSTATQNVVTYPVVIAAKNPDLKLLPGMTASISFEVDSADGVTKIPNAALRFFPSDIKWVRPEDRRLIDGSTWNTPTEDSEEGEESELSASERAKARKDRNKRHVWVVDGEKLRAVEVETGLSESKYTQLTDGEIAPGDALVTGQKGG